MPTYNYKCLECNEFYSIFQKMSDNPLTLCEKCGGKINRVISGGTGMIFKGSGFYLTDYGKSKTKEAVDNKEKSKKEDSKSKKEKTKGKNDE